MNVSIKINTKFMNILSCTHTLTLMPVISIVASSLAQTNLTVAATISSCPLLRLLLCPQAVEASPSLQISLIDMDQPAGLR